MKKLSLALFFSLLPFTASATITGPIQTNTGSCSNCSAFNITVTAPSAGNIETLQYQSGDPTVSISSITQTNVTWHATADKAVASGRHAEIWHTDSIGASAGTLITINLDGVPTLTTAAAVFEWNSTAGLTLDAVNSNNGTASGNVDGGSITPTSGRNTLMIYSLRLGGAYSSGPDSGFTRGTSQDGGSRGEEGYLITTSSGSYDPVTTAGNGTWAGVIASYVEPAVSASTAPTPRIIMTSGGLFVFGSLIIM